MEVLVVALDGQDLMAVSVFGPDDCWSVRRGRLHKVEDPREALRCSHVPDAVPGGYRCVPLIAQGETLGVLHLQTGPRANVELTEKLATTVGVRLALTLVNLVVLVWLFIRSPQHRWPVALMVTGQIAGRVLFAVDEMVGDPAPGAELLLIASAVPFAFYAIALFGFRIFDPLPMARQVVFEQLRAGVVVFDPLWRVIGLNPADGLDELTGDDRTVGTMPVVVSIPSTPNHLDPACLSPPWPEIRPP